MRRLLLTAVYWLVVTPWGRCRRLRDPLALRWRPRDETYWHFTP
ncbi:hypothetical protein ACFP1Z_16070 [Streptomyces gamaensis]|uniref:Transposase n=1 Tax=Streptomyces gamaensis TaxID=1763542 RepID=A0ABW0Z3P1_9ACTN